MLLNSFASRRMLSDADKGRKGGAYKEERSAGSPELNPLPRARV